MADQTTKSIRRIVKGMKDDPVGLGDAEDYKSIGTSRGEGYVNSRGDVTGSGSSGSGDKEEQPDSSAPPTDNPSDNDTGGGGGINDGRTQDGDVADVHDDASSGDTITEVTGTSSDGGTFYTLAPNTIEGIEYIPPDGWGDPDGDPPQGYQHGYYWTTTAFGGSIGGDTAWNSPGTLWDAAIVQINSDPNRQNAALFSSSITATDGEGIATAWLGVIESFRVSDNFRFTDNVDAIRNTCSGTTSYCPATEDEVLPAEQPSDGICQIAYDHDAGGYKGHEKDPDCSASEKTASECVIIRSSTQSTRYFRYCRLADGGTKITEVDSSGAPKAGTIVKTTDADGRVNGFYDVSLDPSIT
jgi:hypothetical protein